MTPPSTSSAAPTRSRLQRWVQHRWFDDTDVERAFGPQGLASVEAEIGRSEGHHRGEIRVCVEAGLPLSALWAQATARQRAVSLFGKLAVWDTTQRSGVLLYVLLAERAVELVADRGVAAVVPQERWQHIVDELSAALRAGRGAEGLKHAVIAVGAVLQSAFPLTADNANPNELSNRVERR